RQEVHERFGTRPFGYKPECLFDFLIGNGPRVTEILDLINGRGETNGRENVTWHPLQRTQYGHTPHTSYAEGNAQRNHLIGGNVEDAADPVLHSANHSPGKTLRA